MSTQSELLEKLLASEVFASDFPKRRQITYMEWVEQGLPQRDPSAIKAINRFPNRDAIDQLVGIVRVLAKQKHVASVPTLAQIWRECALVPLRDATGHALREIGTPEALSALIETLEDAHWFSILMGVRAIFDTAPDKAYDRLISFFEPERLNQPGGTAIAFRSLGFFAPTSFSNKGPGWTEERAPVWLREDRRWLELCVRLRHHDPLGTAARRVLRYVDPPLFLDMLEHVRKTEDTPVVTPRSSPVGDLVARYRQGEHEQVWHELRRYPAITGDLRLEALAVVTETMRRVAHNVDLLAPRLEKAGWQPLTGALRSSLDAHDLELIARLERISRGPIPPSLLGFWQLVGAIDFVWDYNKAEKPPDLFPGISLFSLDPLFVCRPSGFSYQFEYWEEEISTSHPELLDPLSLALAPDDYHKANISGGSPYSIDLPFAGADPVFENERHGLPFVDYLRLCLQWGGFPGLENHASDPMVSTLVAGLTEDFLPF